MSNTDKSVAAPKPGVVITRWWWVRHAPVREDGGCIYGQKDLGCDTSDRVVFDAVGKILPRDAIWYASNLKRTHQTADAIWAAGFPKPAKMTIHRGELVLDQENAVALQDLELKLEHEGKTLPLHVRVAVPKDVKGPTSI